MTDCQSTQFDQFADSYEAALNQGLSVSGEGKDFFAQRRIAWLRKCLASCGGVLEDAPKSVLDFGCGTGSAVPFLLSEFSIEHLLGVDVSRRSVECATAAHGSRYVRFELLDSYTPAADIDLVYSNGVFHHIPPAERAHALQRIHAALRPGGIFSFWENNPWNPGTRYVMSRIPFDRDAITISLPEARALLRRQGFQVIRCDTLFYFPRALAPLRFLEPWLSALPLGAQYQVLCRKPTAAAAEAGRMEASPERAAKTSLD